MNPFENKDNDETPKFFQSLGYKTSWDFDSRKGDWWYEILDDDGLVLQVEGGGVPLADLIEDLVCFYNGIPGTSKSYYWMCLGKDPNSPEAKELVKKVYEYSVQERQRKIA